MSGEASNEPEPLEDRIARVIENALEPFVVGLLAALISPAQCAQGIDRESEDQRWKAITLGRILVNESRENLRSAYSRMEQFALGLEAHKKQQSPKEDWLYLSMKLGDDSFRAYLREKEAPRKIQDRDAIAHYRALAKLNLGGLLLAERASDGELFGYNIRKIHADDYLKTERLGSRKAVTKSRQKSSSKTKPKK